MRVTLKVLAATTVALALAGTAVGQGNPVYGVMPQEAPITSTNGGTLAAPDLGPFPDPKREATVKAALHGYQRACEPDRRALCMEKKGAAGDHCLIYHRLRLSTSCKQAMDSLVLAQSGAL